MKEVLKNPLDSENRQSLNNKVYLVRYGPNIVCGIFSSEQLAHEYISTQQPYQHVYSVEIYVLNKGLKGK